MISLWGASSGSKPNLVLDFIGSETLDPRVTFSRASNATRTNAQGLITYAPHNLELYSQTFANAFWDKAGGLVTVADNFTTAPDGTTTATKWSEAAGTGSHHIHDAAGNFTPVVGQAYTMSMYLKQTETNPDRYVQMVFWLAGFPATAYANFDMQTGAIAFQGAGLTSATITPENNGWYRLSISAVATATGASGWQAAFISNANAARAESYTVTAGNEESYYLWGAQVNLRGLVDYTPTTSAVAYGPRFDFNPVTLQPKGLLIEEQRTNLLTYSAQFDNAAWSVAGALAITPDSTTAPDGTLTADKLTEDTSAGYHRLVNVTATSVLSTQNTVSFFVQANGRTKCHVYVFNNAITTNFIQGTFNLTTVTATATIGGTGSTPVASIYDAGNGWYRCSISGIIDTGVGSAVIQIQVRLDNGAGQAYTGNGTSGIYIWGAQLEVGAFPTSYIPTVASQASRAADNAVMTGTNFSSWYRQDEGSVLCRTSVHTRGSSTNQVVYIGPAGGAFGTGVYLNAPSTQITLAPPAPPVNVNSFVADTTSTTFTSAFGLKNNSAILAVNNILGIEDTSCTMPIADYLAIGKQGWLSATGTYNGHIIKLAYYPKRLTNAELQSLTS